MYLERLSESNKSLFPKAFSLYEASFPREERRDSAEQARVLAKEDYHVDFIMDDGVFSGIMLYWETDSFIYLEHFTTLPELRNRGLGANALSLLMQKGKTVLLEIEPPVDDITKRRYGFYKRNGFLMNPHHHIQAKYHLGDEDLELKILSYPNILTKDEYIAFQNYMTKEIGILPHCDESVTVRRLRADDDLLQVGKLIYLSDDYIYPYWFDSIEDGKRVIAEMTKLDTLYNMNNVTVAVMPNGDIAAAAVTKQCPFNEEESVIEKAFENTGIKSDKRTHEIFLAYYAEMAKLEDGLYLANIAVDPNYRKRGIAATLLNEILKDTELCRLECVKANSGAWRLYQRLGFEITEEYPGVLDVPCYKMSYRRKT